MFSNVLAQPAFRFSSFFVLLFSLFLSGCGGGSGDGAGVVSDSQYSVGGSVSGLSGSGLVLQNNGDDDLAVAGGSFEFAALLIDGNTYEVSVKTQPMGQTCVISNGSGTITGEDVTDVTVTCSDPYTIGGSVWGLSGAGLVLQNNGGDDLAVAGNSFEFATALVDGASYAVTVKTQPTDQSCAISNASGTIADADVTDVAVTCRQAGNPCGWIESEWYRVAGKGFSSPW